jgi:hypothetical protein
MKQCPSLLKKDTEHLNLTQTVPENNSLQNQKLQKSGPSQIAPLLKENQQFNESLQFSIRNLFIEWTLFYERQQWAREKKMMGFMEQLIHTEKGIMTLKHLLIYSNNTTNSTQETEDNQNSKNYLTML